MSERIHKPPAPFSLRLSQDERVRLERDAGGLSLGAYIRWRLFDPSTPPPRHRGQFPVKDHQLLAGLLARLGASRLPNNLNQLAHLAHTGSLPVTPETEDVLRQAAADVGEMRRVLLDALGLRADSP